MDVLYLLIPLSVVLVFLIGALFWWSLNTGQFDDLEGPAHRVLHDDSRVLQDNNRVLQDDNRVLQDDNGVPRDDDDDPPGDGRAG